MAKRIYHAAVYVRLSKEDGDVVDAKKAESNSISNQKSLIFNFIKTREDIQVSSVHEDDGYSGSSFDRPGFRRMMEEIETGRADCCIVKDLSRFGREYITAGHYIQRVFPALGVRFIAINDGVDTLDSNGAASEILIPVKNLFNDAYCLDTSVKIRSQLDAKRKNGEYVGSFCPYGYRKSPDDHNRLVPDEYAAGVVRDFFRHICEGLSLEAIAQMLDGMGIKPPMEYKRSIGVNYHCNFKKTGTSGWSAVAVRRIATNPVYMGTLVQGRVSTPNHKVKRRVQRLGDDLITVPHSHTPIVGEREFETVQRLLSKDMRTAPGQRTVYLLSGLCRCGDCGAPMTRKTSAKNGKQYAYYMCSAHRRFGSCTPHRIPQSRMENAVINTIQTVIATLSDRTDVEDILKRLRKGQDQDNSMAEQQRRNDEEIALCERMLSSLYEDFREGIVGEKDFAVIKKNLSERRAKAEEAAGNLDIRERQDAKRQERIKSAVEDFLSYKEMENPDRAAIVRMVREVVVYEGARVEVVMDCDDGLAGLLTAKPAAEDILPETDGAERQVV